MTTNESPRVDEGLPEISARSILRSGGPRFALNAGGPVLFFYAGWKLSGLLAGVVIASAVGIGAYLRERRRQRPGLVARLALLFVLVQAAFGLSSGSVTVYLAPPVVVQGLLGLVFVASVLRGRPLAARFAEELHSFPPAITESEAFHRSLSMVSLAWGICFLLRGTLRLLVLAHSVDAFVVVNVATGLPLISALLTWSAWYVTRALRRSEASGWPAEPAPA
jgi:hypothetical protein